MNAKMQKWGAVFFQCLIMIKMAHNLIKLKCLFVYNLFKMCIINISDVKSATYN